MGEHTARMEITAGIVRVYHPDRPPPGAPVAAVAISASEGTAIVKALVTSELALKHAAAIRTCLRENGFDTAMWERRDSSTGAHRPVRVSLGPAPYHTRSNQA